MDTNTNHSTSLDQSVIDLLVSLKYRDRFPVRLLSMYYPLNNKELSFYEDLWDWRDISANENIQIDANFVETYEERLDWFWISQRPQNFSEEFLDKYKDKLDWYSLSWNSSIDWNQIRLEKYKDKLDWARLLQNMNVKITEEVIYKYEDYFEFRDLSLSDNIVFTKALLERYKDKWHWKFLSRNNALHIDLQLTEEYAGYIDISEIFSNSNISDIESLIEEYHQTLNWTALSAHSLLPLSKKFIAQYSNSWDWSWLSRNGSLPASIDVLRTFEDKLDWDMLSVNNAILADKNIIREFKNRWHWGRLSQYIRTELTEEFIEEFEDYWDWDAISSNPTFPVSKRVLDKYIDRIEKYQGLSSNNSTAALLNYMESNNDLKKLEWDYVSKAEAVDLDIKTFLRYEDFWNYGKVIYNKKLCAKIIEESVNELVVFEVMESYRDAKSRRYPKSFALTSIQKEIACIELVKSFTNGEVIENDEYYAKLAIENQDKDYAVPDNKSFVELWEMYGFNGSGIGNQNGGSLNYSDMEECLYRWFEILYDRSTAELDIVKEDARMARGTYIENLRIKGLRINLGPGIFYLAGDIQREFGNY